MWISSMCKYRNKSLNDISFIIKQTKIWNKLYKNYKQYIESGTAYLIKYENLIEEPFEQFKKILEFINKFLEKKIIIDKQKIEQAINESSFKNLSKLEENQPFPEKLNDVKFFRKGISEEWKKVLNPVLVKKIEDCFSDEMKKLNYI